MADPNQEFKDCLARGDDRDGIEESEDIRGLLKGGFDILGRAEWCHGVVFALLGGCYHWGGGRV